MNNLHNTNTETDALYIRTGEDECLYYVPKNQMPRTIKELDATLTSEQVRDLNLVLMVSEDGLYRLANQPYSITSFVKWIPCPRNC